MGELIEQYLGAIQQWIERTGQPNASLIPSYMFLMAGGRWPTTIQASASAGAVIDQFSLENTRTFLESILLHIGFTETFLVVAFIRAIEDQFRVDLALYDQEQAERAQHPQSMREMATNPELFQGFQELARQAAPELNVIPEDLRAAADKLESLMRCNPADNMLEKIQVEQALLMWREVTAPILEPANLKASQQRDVHRRMGDP